MYVYVIDKDGGYCVGFFDPRGIFALESVHFTATDAAARVSYLNGGEIDKSAAKLVKTNKPAEKPGDKSYPS